MELVKDIFLWSENKGLFTSKYKDEKINIEELAKELLNTETNEVSNDGN